VQSGTNLIGTTVPNSVNTIGNGATSTNTMQGASNLLNATTNTIANDTTFADATSGIQVTGTGVDIKGGTNSIAGTTNINTTTTPGTLTTIGNVNNAVTDKALQLNGSMSSTGNSTIATANNTTNTFGSGSGANNTVGGGSNSVNTIGNAGTSTNTMQGSTNTITGSTSTVVTGGTTTMTLNNNGASFANNGTGAPVRVGGVADGVAPNDAVNKRQYDILDNKLGGVADKAYAGVASALAMSALPQIRPGFNYNIGMAVGNYANQSAVAIGAKANIGENWQVNASAGVSQGNNAIAVGAGFSW
jgi:hypothetical protein